MNVAGIREKIRECIPSIAKPLEEQVSWVRQAALELLSSLTAYGMYYHLIPVMCSNMNVAEFYKEIGEYIPMFRKCVMDRDEKVRRAAIELLSSLATYGVC